MKKIGIIQTGKIGDILICLPIAKYYFDQGYQIIWPIAHQLIRAFSNAIEFVNFIPVESVYHLQSSRSILACYPDIKILDLQFGFQRPDNLTQQWRQSGMHFDEYKYYLSQVPFELKWGLKDFIKRDNNRELELYNKINPTGKYLLYQFVGSEETVNITIPDDIRREYQLIEIKPITDNFLDWLLLIERADKLLLIDSCYVNLIDQLGFKNTKTRIRKPLCTTDIDYPILRETWKDIRL